MNALLSENELTWGRVCIASTPHLTPVTPHSVSIVFVKFEKKRDPSFK